VTNAADADSRKMVNRLHRDGVQTIILTGCWASVDLINDAKLPEGTICVPNSEKEHIVQQYFTNPEHTPVVQPMGRIPLPGKARRTRAFIKVQEGCDYHCTYCITRIARGRSVSVPVETILDDVRSAVLTGTKEIVLTGTQLGGWGKDFSEKRTISDLVKVILKETDIPQVRLSSIEPWDIDEKFFTLLSEPRFCDHLHLPLQSGCSRTLKRMGRRMSPAEYAHLLEQLRSHKNDLAITTDILVGFPGETQADHLESMHFVQEMQFAGGHVFRYSPRPGTPAALFPNQVDEKVKKKRNKAMREVVEHSTAAYRSQYIDREVKVLWERGQPEGDGRWRMYGLSKNYLRIQASTSENLWNQIAQVIISNDRGRYMEGHISTGSKMGDVS
jgi:threonylcarbamoyladenosine tRNA methylthiotransferase MtaB